ncbi:CdaR family protein [Aciduricibacillus chroicocephali]|uniref:CdaR family protein n=1 Tax=Aciduricibacillus chroicocephali TaxID=3054939 RepID=A0ABY9KW10_9BACI|nr:CdaR family protein [Bacillaceae bacterium 44XB]
MDKWLRSKWFVSILSLALTILLYVFVNVETTTSQKDPRYTPSNSEETEQVENMPVNIKINDEKYVVSGVPESVNVSLEGSASILRPTARQRAFDVYVDLRNLGPGEHTVEVEYANIPKGLKAYIEPKTVDVTLEKRATKTFKVKADYINEDKLPKGYELGEPVIEPDTVKITSSDSVIDQIALVKVFVDVTGLTDSVHKREVPVNVYDHLGNELDVKIEPKNVLVSLDVHNPNKRVPVKLKTEGELPDGLELNSIKAEPNEVEIYGKKDLLKEIDSISTETIDLAKVKGSGKIDANLKWPDQVKASKKTVIITVELKQKLTIKDVPIQAEGLGAGLQVQFEKPDDAVTDVAAEGKEEQVSNLASDDLRAKVDLSGLDKGKHEVIITVTGPDQVKLTPKTESATVVIS